MRHCHRLESQESGKPGGKKFAGKLEER